MRSRLNERIASLTTNIFTLVVMTNRILEAEKRVSAALAGQPDELRRVRQQMAGFRRRVVTRYYDIAGTKAEPAKFDEKGVLKLGAGWDFNSEKLSIKYWQNKSDDGVNVLGIGTSEASSRGSWRLTVALEPGHYRFEARVRSRNVEPFNNTSGNGAGIRISGSRRQNMLRGTQDWKNLTFDFELESSNEIQLIAEIAANSGEAEFDLDSLRLVRK